MKVLLIPESVKKESKSTACVHLGESQGQFAWFGKSLSGLASVSLSTRRAEQSRTGHFVELATANGPLQGLTSGAKSPTKENRT